MIQTLSIAKLSGSGNDHICIDGRDGRLDAILNDPARSGPFACALCRRGMGVGADGIIVAVANEVEQVADASARFFEADGSENDLCGNGLGCFVRWVLDSGWVRPPEARDPRRLGRDGEVCILTPVGVVRGRASDGQYVRVCIPTPEDFRRDLAVRTGDRVWDCDYVSMGIPHLATYVDDVSAVEVSHWGPLLRHHEQFAPRGVNVNFIQVLGEGEIALRTFEYGVEGETLSCGTGSAASAVLTTLREGWDREYSTGEKPVRIHSAGGDTLRVFSEIDANGKFVDMCLETVVRFLYRAEVHGDLLRVALQAHGAPNAAVEAKPSPV